MPLSKQIIRISFVLLLGTAAMGYRSFAFTDEQRVGAMLQSWEKQNRWFCCGDTAITTTRSPEDIRFDRFDWLWPRRANPANNQAFLEFIRPSSTTQISRATSSVRWLGETEDSAVMPKLKELLATPGEFRVRPIIVKLAIIRIETKDLHGKERLEALCNGLDLTWPQMVILTKRAYSSNRTQKGKGGYEPVLVRDDMAFEVARTLTSILFDMGSRGEDVSPFIKELDLPGYLRVKINNVGRSRSEQARRIFRYLRQPLVYPEVELIEDDISFLQPESKLEASIYLREMSDNPKACMNSIGYRVVFDTCFQLNIKEARRILEPLEKKSWALSKSFKAGQPGYYFASDLERFLSIWRAKPSS